MTKALASYPSLRDRVVLVTGGASGIGADIVHAFHRNGARVAFFDIQEEAGNALQAQLPGSIFLTCDITDIAAIKRAIAEVYDRVGPTSVLINNAANDDRRGLDTIDEAYWDWSQNVNLKHMFFAAQAVAPMMRELGGGSIVNLSSIAWRFGAPELTAYVTAKAAIIGLTHSLARKLGPDGIRVNAIEPGAVMTPKQRKLWYPTPESIRQVVSRQALACEVDGNDIANMALFLAADDSSAITKQTMTVDAGLA